MIGAVTLSTGLLVLGASMLGCSKDMVDDSGPGDTAFERGELRFSALVPDNAAGDTDEAGEFDDWLEIKNFGENAVTLSGWSVGDGYPDELAWSIPESTLDAGESLRIWCDNDPQDGDYHADFKLSKAGETLTLLDNDTLADQVTWPALEPDQVYTWDGSEWSVQE